MKIYRHRKYFFTSLLIVIAMLQACTKQPPPYAFQEHDLVQITGCYSNLFQHEETGDILGLELFIIYSDDSHHVLYQESEGWPRVLMLLPVLVEGDTIRFTISRDNGKRLDTFKGTVAAGNLTGSFDNGEKIILPRKNSFWQ